MTSPNLADSDGLFPLVANVCDSPRPGLVRVRNGNSPWRLTCVNPPKFGQNGLRVRMHEDPYAPVPGQMTIDDMIAAPLASLEDVAAADFAERLVQAILAGEHVKPMLGLATFGTFMPMQSSGVNTPGSVEKSIARCGTISASPRSTTEEC